MPRKNLTDQRNADIHRDFLKEYKKGYRPDVIYDNLSKQYYVTAKTVAGIVSKHAKTVTMADSGKDVP